MRLIWIWWIWFSYDVQNTHLHEDFHVHAHTCTCNRTFLLLLLRLCLVNSSLVWKEKRTGRCPGGANQHSALRSVPPERLTSQSTLWFLEGETAQTYPWPCSSLSTHYHVTFCPALVLLMAYFYDIIQSSGGVVFFFFFLFLCTTCTDSGTAVRHFLSFPKPNRYNSSLGQCFGRYTHMP